MLNKNEELKTALLCAVEMHDLTYPLNEYNIENVT